MTGKTPPTEPSAVVVPFGKHKGKTVAELVTVDPAYADWISAQGWVADRFAELHAAIVTRGAGSDDTPEHNALQARFLDDSFAAATLECCASSFLADIKFRTARDIFVADMWKSGTLDYNTKWDFDRIHDDDQQLEFLATTRAEVLRNSGLFLFTSRKFEVLGVDVVISFGYAKAEADAYLRVSGFSVKVELKPAMGDDYPSVMRQMKRLGAGVLVVGKYTGRGVSEVQLRQMFSASGLQITFVQEIEEAMRRP